VGLLRWLFKEKALRVVVSGDQIVESLYGLVEALGGKGGPCQVLSADTPVCQMLRQRQASRCARAAAMRRPAGSVEDALQFFQRDAAAGPT